MICAKPGAPIPDLGAPTLPEPALPRHPLAGIVAALEACAPSGRPLVVIACDMPFVPPALLALLASSPGPLVATALEGRPEPLLARYEPSLLPALRRARDREAPLVRTVAELDPQLLGEEDLARFGDPRRILTNVNDRRDLEAAAAYLTAGRRGRQ